MLGRRRNYPARAMRTESWLGGFDILETSQTRGMALSAPREEKAKVVVTMDNSV